MKNLFKHLKTIRTHRKWVRKYCFKCGLFWQGITHDLSKYSIAELLISKYYTGKKSPHQTCREQIGYSPSWIHHYHINKHHFQYWWDEDEKGQIIPIKMPYKYLIESFCDMIGASRAYNPNNWDKRQLLDYWNNKCQDRLMQYESFRFLEVLINRFVEADPDEEKEFFKTIKTNRHKATYEEDDYI